MAAFQICEDLYNFIPTTKIVNKIPTRTTSFGIQKKANLAKDFNNPMKTRLPLRITNQIPNKKQAEQKNQTKVKNTQQFQIYSDQSENLCIVKNEPKPITNYDILQDVSFVKKENDKENLDNAQESQDQFYFPIDNFYLITKEYHDNIYGYLLDLERNSMRPKPNYMSKQPQLTNKMRSILVDWLSAVTEEYCLQPQTLHLAVQFIDSFLSRMSVVKGKFQLVGTAAMMIAAKYEEIYPPDAKEWSYLTADSFTSAQLLRMEQLILKVLQFNLTSPTIYSFIAHICFVCNVSKKLMLLAMYFSELVLLEGEEYTEYLPSQLAFSAVALARHTLNEKVIWPKNLQMLSGYNIKELSPLIKKQQKSFRDSPTRTQQAIQDKFKTVKYGRVSLLKPRKLNLCDIDE